VASEEAIRDIEFIASRQRKGDKLEEAGLLSPAYIKNKESFSCLSKGVLARRQQLKRSVDKRLDMLLLKGGTDAREPREGGGEGKVVESAGVIGGRFRGKRRMLVQKGRQEFRTPWPTEKEQRAVHDQRGPG